MIRLAAKRLSQVEISKRDSNQHEFHAGVLRKALGFSTERNAGVLHVTFVSDADDPEEELDSYTLYDARKDTPGRTEYHLYYSSKNLQARARQGDILILIRLDEETTLRALIVAEGSQLGHSISSILSDRGVQLERKFREVKTVIRGSDLAHLLGHASERKLAPGSEVIIAAASASFLAGAITRGALPSTKQMSAEAVRVLTKVWPGALDPDGQLYWSLEAETALFGHLEEKIGQKALNDLGARGEISFADATALVLKRLQSRKSRRGHSLQNHFAAVLKRFDIPFKEQCETEHGETPDFLIPGCAEYLDLDFPAARLRLVACKSTVKERWGQILKEADRIPHKYLLTLDEGLTEDGVGRMLNSGLALFLPKPIIDRAYAGSTVGAHVETVTDLIGRLAASGSPA